ncbi:energy-coupling factor transporter ATPase [Sinanaerobacter sp. ZZT-01]|uniref:energy-coupling factor transporter ATPase n=1 Tax=Sinanaerobacter sp. ZZT-01 TaxID=3111540 RepID=UPI002D76A79F|nr:energy-coupling factor transporter ATPase [Sinanaerobacter sp. ZZT-01]WRR92107.1 energy-coupling factor transporter ATPase [Sinanaerobacter sp. ZZT-01]
MPQIQVKELTHIYAEGMPFETVALDRIHFEIEQGEFVGIIGHTGSGKSTLIQHLNGLLKPKSGQIIIEGLDITNKSVKMRDIRTKIGLVFQYPEYQLFEETVEKDIAFGPLNLGVSKDEAAKRVKEAMQLVGLDYKTLAKRSPFALSGGQKRRVAIAGVVAMRPKVLILDEPTAGLDPKAHQDVLQMVETIHRKEGITILLVSHNMGDIARLADKVLVMDGGRLVMTGTPSEIFHRAEDLKRMNLALPPATELMYRLKTKGAPVSADVLTIAEAEEEIYRWIGKR